jgi:hypothetical protein
MEGNLFTYILIAAFVVVIGVRMVITTARKQDRNGKYRCKCGRWHQVYKGVGDHVSCSCGAQLWRNASGNVYLLVDNPYYQEQAEKAGFAVLQTRGYYTYMYDTRYSYK